MTVYYGTRSSTTVRTVRTSCASVWISEKDQHCRGRPSCKARGMASTKEDVLLPVAEQEGVTFTTNGRPGSPFASTGRLTVQVILFALL